MKLYRIQIGLIAAGLTAVVAHAAPPSSKADFWSFKAPVRPPVPAVQNAAWVRNSIDAFILARLQKEGLTPSAPADRQTLIRRIYFDLIGLPPTPPEIDAFVKDPAPDAYETLVDRLLASPRYGERWARHWLDVVRYSETHGFEENQPRPNAWPYRDYVIRAFNQNLPYDRFIREQVAGDALGEDPATGFLVAGPFDEVKSPDPVLTAQQRADELHDMVSTTGATFLGLTVGCARCHDHKFDAISQVDYYRMTAVLSGVQHGERPRHVDTSDPRIAALRRQIDAIDTRLDEAEPIAQVNGSQVMQIRSAPRMDRNVDRFSPANARYVRFTILETNDGVEPCVDEIEVFSADGKPPRDVALASAGAVASASGTYAGLAIHKLEHINDGLFGNSHSWISNQPGVGWVQIALPRVERIDRVVWQRDRESKFPDRLPTKYRVEIALDLDHWQTVASSDDRALFGTAPRSTDSDQRHALVAEQQELERQIDQNVGAVYGGQFVQPGPGHVLSRGDPMQPKQVVAPGGIAALSPQLDLVVDAPEQQRRVALADWLTNPTNPLPARVMVNRLWQHHFGRGIVATPSDFGHMGVPPTHPELLDWLAVEFISRGWDIKAIQRLIVTSNTYRQASDTSVAGVAADAGTTLLWRFPPQRLEAEPIRDSILQDTGKLDLTMGGPGFDVFKPNGNYVRIYAPKEIFGPPEWRRMIYRFLPRMQQDATFGAFDCPDGGQMAPKRTVSTTPLQALNLLNSGFMMQQAQLLADRLTREAGNDPAAQATLAFRLCFGRLPSDKERDASVQFIHSQSLELFCRALFNANEFLYVS